MIDEVSVAPTQPGEPDKAKTAARLERFNSLCGALRRDLYRFAFWLTRDPALADDVVQETLLRAWSSFDSLADARAARAWLLTIVRREAARTYALRRPLSNDIDEIVAVDDIALATSHEPDMGDVRREILRLDDIYREPLVLQVHFGYTTLEIARHMQINRATVLTRLHRAREKLRLRLGATGTDGELSPATDGST